MHDPKDVNKAIGMAKDIEVENCSFARGGLVAKTESW